MSPIFYCISPTFYVMLPTFTNTHANTHRQRQHKQTQTLEKIVRKTRKQGSKGALFLSTSELGFLFPTNSVKPKQAAPNMEGFVAKKEADAGLTNAGRSSFCWVRRLGLAKTFNTDNRGGMFDERFESSLRQGEDTTPHHHTTHNQQTHTLTYMISPT